MASTTNSSTLTNFPLELAQAILSSAPNSFTLRALAHSNSSFHQAFLGAKPLILRHVLENEFPSGPAILPDAIAALAAARLPLKEAGEREDFLLSLTYDVFSIPETWTLQDSIALSKIRTEVQFFTKRYASTLTGNPVTGVPDQNPIQLTSTETDRIERAFYRFELYCNLFRDEENAIGRPTSRKRRELFFDKFSPWENEQFACAYKYLFSEVATAHNDVAAHEIEWAEIDICPDNWSYIDTFLSLGLGFIRRVVEAKTYEERFETLRLELNMDSWFLEEILSEENLENEGKNVGDLTEEERRAAFEPQLYPDPDPGPAEIWLWAYKSFSATQVYYGFEQRYLRKRGYVFFDHSRLRDWEIFSKPFEYIEEPDEGEYSHMSDDDWTYSYEERCRIWELGGRGWWTKGDESKVVWPFKKDTEWVTTDNPRFTGPGGFYHYISFRREPLLRRSWGPYGEFTDDN